MTLKEVVRNIKMFLDYRLWKVKEAIKGVFQAVIFKHWEKAKFINRHPLMFAAVLGLLVGIILTLILISL